jgi:nicotinamidase-related amidase
MSRDLTIDRAKTAVLMMHYQNDIVALLTQKQQKVVLQRAKQVLDAVRDMGMLVVHTVALGLFPQAT